MKPAYTPFTYIAEATIKRIHHHVGPFILMQPVSGNEPLPVKQGRAAGNIEVQAPVQGDEPRILDAVRRFRTWGTAHQGHMGAFKAMSGEGQYEEAFAAEIRSDILRGEPRKDPSDPIAAARLFLALAQEFDMQQTELDTELEASEWQQKEMFSELKGDSETRLPLADRYSPEDPGQYHSAKRIISWLRLLKEEAEPSRVWITDSRAVFEYMLEHLPGAGEIQVLDSLAGTGSARDPLLSYLAELSESRQPDSVNLPEPLAVLEPGGRDVLTIAALPFETPAAVLEQLLSRHSSPGREKPDKHLVLLLLEAKG